jgi:hypothetical protein
MAFNHNYYYVRHVQFVPFSKSLVWPALSLVFVSIQSFLLVRFLAVCADRQSQAHPRIPIRWVVFWEIHNSDWRQIA